MKKSTRSDSSTPSSAPVSLIAVSAISSARFPNARSPSYQWTATTSPFTVFQSRDVSSYSTVVSRLGDDLAVTGHRGPRRPDRRVGDEAAAGHVEVPAQGPCPPAGRHRHVDDVRADGVRVQEPQLDALNAPTAVNGTVNTMDSP